MEINDITSQCPLINPGKGRIQQIKMSPCCENNLNLFLPCCIVIRSTEPLLVTRWQPQVHYIFPQD